MQDSWSTATMLLLAVLVGAALPVLLQMFMTLGATRRLIHRVGPKIDGTLSELLETSRRLNRATTGLEDSAQRARVLLEATGELGRTVQQIQRSLKPAVALGSALGPALAVAIQTLVERYGRNPGAPTDEADTARPGDAESPEGTNSNEQGGET